MKIRPVILCGGAGTRLWPNAKNHQAKQFIDFGSWTLLGKTLERVKASFMMILLSVLIKNILNKLNNILKNIRLKNLR